MHWNVAFKVSPLLIHTLTALGHFFERQIDFASWGISFTKSVGKLDDHPSLGYRSTFAILFWASWRKKNQAALVSRTSGVAASVSSLLSMGYLWGKAGRHLHRKKAPTADSNKRIQRSPSKVLLPPTTFDSRNLVYHGDVIISWNSISKIWPSRLSLRKTMGFDLTALIWWMQTFYGKIFAIDG